MKLFNAFVYFATEAVICTIGLILLAVFIVPLGAFSKFANWWDETYSREWRSRQ